jgi:predicted house-cleaning noncanonical NTP pyrophosphatase (MazG superfamily)
MEKKQPLIEQIYESWEWKLREKLSDANDVVRRIFHEYKRESGNRVNEEMYEAFMRDKLAELLREIGDQQ